MIKNSDDINADQHSKMTLIVYGREACHLCQQMILALKQVQKQSSLGFKVIDIDSDPELVQRYNEKIPVLVSALDGQEICHYFLDMSALGDYLDKFR